MEQYLQVGILTSTHGVHGEVRVFPTTDDVKRFSKLKEVWLQEPSGEKILLHVKGVKYAKNLVILKFEGFDTIESIDRYRTCPLLVTRDNAVRLQKDEYYIADLIGMRVVDENETQVGELTQVLETGANDVYVIKKADGSELLLPAIRQCILKVDVEGSLMHVMIPEGL
ncbi:MAG: 16S rRNA processing protein RimM [Lachnospiraceae bacterium]|nr:16S rRNA processing protein RimM [Lachnospiraceae bacterium]